MRPSAPAAAATLTGFGAILLWSLLAVLTVASGAIPPFQLAAMTFAIGALAGAAALALNPRSRALRFRHLPPIAWLHGVGGLFGYHALYFFALRSAPPAEAGLLNYLWPLFIVLLSGLLPGEHLRWHHIAGACCGFAGTTLLIAARGGLAFGMNYAPGLVAALAAAVVWAVYSVTSRRLAAVPPEAVVPFCAATAVAAALVHLLAEQTVWPATITQALAVLALGLGPVGIAFLLWQIGMKQGDVKMLGVASYAAPVLSTGFLVLAGQAEPTATLALAALLVAGGGLLAAKDMLIRRSA